MERSIVDELPSVRADAIRRDAEARDARQGTRRRLPRWLLGFGFWTLIVLAYSTRQELRFGPYEWMPISWFEAFKAAVAQWYSWGILSIAIYWVNRTLPFAPNALLSRLAVHIPLSIVFTVAYSYIDYGATQLLDAPSDRNWVGPTLLDTMGRVTYRLGTFVYWAIAMVCIALDYQADVKDREVRAAELERLLSEARLETLRTQLDPHFLFNTLNSISAYVESAPREARLMLERLGDLLRRSMEHASEQEISLERELAFVDLYIQLQLVRFSDRLDVRVRVDPDVTAAAVPTFILQPLIENAIRHGIAKLTTPGMIELAAWRSGARLHLRVRDNGPGLPPGWRLDQHVGVGLGNTRARLTHLYGPDDFSLDVSRDDERGTCVDVTLPYRPL